MIYGNKQTIQPARGGCAVVRMVMMVLVCGLAAFALGRCAADWVQPATAAPVQTAYLQAPAAVWADDGSADETAALLDAAAAQTEAERIEALKAYEQADFDFMRGVVYEPVDQ